MTSWHRSCTDRLFLKQSSIKTVASRLFLNWSCSSSLRPAMLAAWARLLSTGQELSANLDKTLLSMIQDPWYTGAHTLNTSTRKETRGASGINKWTYNLVQMCGVNLWQWSCCEQGTARGQCRWRHEQDWGGGALQGFTWREHHVLCNKIAKRSIFFQLFKAPQSFSILFSFLTLPGWWIYTHKTFTLLLCKFEMTLLS